MTEGQVKYQTLVENQRHNYAMERYQAEQAKAASSQAESSARQAGVAERKATVDEYLSKAQARQSYSTMFLNAFKSAEAFASGFKNIMGAVSSIASLFA